MGRLQQEPELLTRPRSLDAVTVRRLVPLVLAAVALALPAAAGADSAPSWTFDLVVMRWVAPSQFSARVTRQLAGAKVRARLPVTLRLDRRTACSTTTTGDASTRIRCASLRPLVASGAVSVRASGQFETSNLGAIGFRARTVIATGR